MPYTPQIGDTARVVVVGPVTQFDPATGQTKVGNLALGAVNFRLADSIVTELEKVQPPESWLDDDVVLSADNRVFRRTRRGTWQKFNGEDVFDHIPQRPLTLLVRDGNAQ